MWFLNWLFDLFQAPSEHPTKVAALEDADEAEDEDEDDEDDEAPLY